MRKGDNRKKNSNLPPLPKPSIDNIMSSFYPKRLTDSPDRKLIKTQVFNLSYDFGSQGQDCIKELSLNKASEERNNLTEEISKRIKHERGIYEKSILSQFEQKYALVKENEERVLKAANEDLAKLTSQVEKSRIKKKELKITIAKLEAEVERYSKLNQSIIDNYQLKLREINDSFHLKLKTTTELFENFLQSNKELLSTDLYSLYHNLKSKFELKLKECLEFKSSNSTLKNENKLFRLSMDTNQDILNKCAQKQIESKKKNKQLRQEVEDKTRLVDQMKAEYKEQFIQLENKFNLLLKDNDEENKSLRLLLKTTAKELEDIKATSQMIIAQRSEIELFFIEAMKEVKKQIIEERKKNRRLSEMNNVLCSKEEESIYLSSIKKVDIKEIDNENKEKLLRMLLTKINQAQANKNYSKLRQLTLPH